MSRVSYLEDGKQFLVHMLDSVRPGRSLAQHAGNAGIDETRPVFSGRMVVVERRDTCCQAVSILENSTAEATFFENNS